MTPEQLKSIMHCSSALAFGFSGPLNDAMDEFSIASPQQQSAFLAQVCHESGALLYTSEIASGAAYDGRSDLGNTNRAAIAIASLHGSSPGRWWKGHGLIQITGYNNHLECGSDLDLDLLNEPTLICNPKDASRSAAWFWDKHRLNDLADSGAFEHITRVINGGLNGYKNRLDTYARATVILS